MNDEQLLRYSRHILLDPIGIEGQDRLLASRALIVGAGGLGCPAALYMAAAGVGTLVIADDDEVDLTNLQRQVLHRQHSVGRAKVESARETLHDINPGIEVIALKTRLAGDALREQVEAADVVLDCSDNFATRHAINRACVAARTPLVSGAAIRFDGQVSVFDSRDAEAPCYHCLFPEGGDADEVRCAVMGVFAPLTGIIGTMQAAEALKLLAQTGRSLAGRLLLLDALGMEWRSITLPRDPACEVCGPRT
ncbi:thiF family protein [Methyloversatilis sp. RAC08]|uniref:HesA/MoeB/ThiF family protein n=1 Tax=Methyloversatilis sp. RAC08 TaxID=1842540 RepID=UPI00083E57A0|nr:molybdopterin-synthase adenylyltransferase MoeB [Methyloversatilis sp. RAC08]AOF81089.1 thiF family protein [Methyloversatilis sp. RAC08]